MDPAHSASPTGPQHRRWTEPTAARHVSADVSICVSTDASHSANQGGFALRPLTFLKINPQYNSVQNDLILTLFSFDLNPKLLKNSTCHPPHTKNQFYLFKIQICLLFIYRNATRPYFMHNFHVLTPIRVILSLTCL
jgi:hypothetical protein